MRSLLGFLGIFGLTFAAPRLLNVQVLFRHGDRTPTATIYSDPYQESFWGLPWGTLTTIGMEQHLTAGYMLKKRYIEDLRFINATYSPYEVKVWSALHDRCLQSAAANFAGFYSDSKYHPSGSGWPKNWTPMPIYTMDPPDYTFEPSQDCPKAKRLIAQRLARQEYLDYEQQHIDIVKEFASKTGEAWTKWWDIISYLGTLTCEKAHDLALPSWVSDSLYNDAKRIRSAILDYSYGMASLNVAQDDQIIRLRTGNFLQHLTKILGSDSATYKYTAYSAHDSTIAAVLYALGPKAKLDILGEGQPEYAATITFETWLLDDGTIVAQILYAKNPDSTLIPVTHLIPGCLSDFCNIQAILGQLRKYTVDDSAKECNS
ncbi:unnamed protein product, partial [Mesorhabditis spiculigera]